MLTPVEGNGVGYFCEKSFERYAADIIVHCKTERQAQYMLARIGERMSASRLTLHPLKARIVNLLAVLREISGRRILRPGTFVSSASKTSIRRKFRELEIHKRRQPIAHLARALNPVIEGIIQTITSAGMRVCVWCGIS